MMITEHNYEEIFLLYIDDELNATERRAVEDFIDRHPHYASVLSTLQDTKLPSADSVLFFGKESLYKDETSDIGINNYEEYFLLYTDSELNDEQKAITERFVLQHPQLQEEFTLLQQTKLTPEPIEYRNKEDLYKKERRVLPLYLAGLSVAAAFIAVLFLTGLFISEPPNHITPSVTMKQVTKPVAIQPALTQPSLADISNPQKRDDEKELPSEEAIKNKRKAEKAIIASEKNDYASKIQLESLRHQSHEEIAVSKTPEEVRMSHPVMPDSPVMTNQVSVLKPLEEYTAEPANTSTALLLSDNNPVQPAVYKELNTDDDNHTLYVSGVALNKNKVNGFLKSASRLLGGRAKQTEE